jgi:predicted nucleotidyltransferase
MVSLKTILTKKASEYFISHGSTERAKINTSISTIKTRIKSDFGKDVNEVKIFGSWDRDTTLPRYYDILSDVDIMIVFNHEFLNRTPETYRKWVKEFAEYRYATSIIQKDFPTVRLDMNHITFDLIPTKIDGFLFQSHYIPDKGNNWMITDPFKFTESVKSANSNNNSIVKPILRLIKAWNAHNNYPFNSYVLEKWILENVSFWNKDVESGFYTAANSFTTWGLTTFQQQKVTSLKNNIGKIEDCLKKNNLIGAMSWLDRILP